MASVHIFSLILDDCGFYSFLDHTTSSSPIHSYRIGFGTTNECCLFRLT
jgi:hypothetical protein